ncbi:hypothetical protein L2E82_37406 [Cichorium intybus]|uniref:Uncharacterized protein n=1 Tax=Cichorium intybus TaxID=13427 RepID=A0ACB9AET1_CICIN|nr:hypothetical protein L2E82_37406 [Cichorium intybus]
MQAALTNPTVISGLLFSSPSSVSPQRRYDLFDVQIGCISLDRAASRGNSEPCELLFEEGADIDTADR